jgi:hypothetical protein
MSLSFFLPGKDLENLILIDTFKVSVAKAAVVSWNDFTVISIWC